MKVSAAWMSIVAGASAQSCRAPSAGRSRCCRRAIVPRAICGQVPLLQARNRAARHLRTASAAAGAQSCRAPSAGSSRCCRRAIVRRAICGQFPLLQARSRAAEGGRALPATDTRQQTSRQHRAWRRPVRNHARPYRHQASAGDVPQNNGPPARATKRDTATWLGLRDSEVHSSTNIQSLTCPAQGTRPRTAATGPPRPGGGPRPPPVRDGATQARRPIGKILNQC